MEISSGVGGKKRRLQSVEIGSERVKQLLRVNKIVQSVKHLVGGVKNN